MNLRFRLMLLVGCAGLCFAPITGQTPFASGLHAQSIDDPNPADDDDDVADNDHDDGITNDDLVETVPDITTEAQWSDPPENVDEQKAAQVDDPNYVQNCADKAACQATLDYVNDQMAALLKGYGEHSTKRRKESGASRSRKLGKTTEYRVNEGQLLELVKSKPGPNDPLLWSEVTKVIPRAQSDRLMGSFRVFRMKNDNTLAFVQGETDSDKFLMAINETTHLATDLREQYLTVVHEFMHMIVLKEFVGGDFHDENPTERARDLSSVAGILQSIFGILAGNEQQEAAPDDEAVANAAVTQCSGVVDDGGCYPEGTIFNNFTRKFWSASDLREHENEDFYDKNKSRFVTEYATKSPHEDISETFSYWVIAEGKGKSIASAKQRFFGRYPQLVALKNHIRRTVIAEILSAQPAKT